MLYCGGPLFVHLIDSFRHQTPTPGALKARKNPMRNMASDASFMLEAALEQMDDIIAGTRAATEYTNGMYDIGSPVPSEYLSTLSILHLVEELKMALETVENPKEKEVLRHQVPGATAACIITWLESNPVNQPPAASNETYQERLTRLEGDKESLVLQVSVLTDQVEAQGEKIRDLESCVDDHHRKLNAAEEMLQQELMQRTSLETEKLDLMTEVSDLKIKLVGLENEQNGFQEKHNRAESVVNLINELQEQMCKMQLEIHTKIKERKARNSDPKANSSSLERDPYQACTRCAGESGLLKELKNLKIKVDELENERSQYEWKMKATKAEIAQLQEQLALKDAEIERLHGQISTSASVQVENAEREDVYKRRLKEKYQEVHRLKLGMESLLAANEEKDHRIEELTVLLSQFRRVKDFVMAAHGSSERLLSGSSEEDQAASLRKLSAISMSPVESLKSEISSKGSFPAIVSPPVPQAKLDASEDTPVPPDTQMLLRETREVSSEITTRTLQRNLSSSLEDLQSESLEKCIDEKPVEPVVEAENKPFLEDSRYMTLPGKFSRDTGNGAHDPYKAIASQSVLQARRGSEENCVLNLRETENRMESSISSCELSPLSSANGSSPQSPVFPEIRRSPKGIKKFWGKIRRTQSGNFNADELGLSEFRRGGFRATAGPRLSRSKETKSKMSDPNAPFSQWNNEQVCSWLEDFGLVQYVMFARQWVSSGQTLLTATPQELEKELGVKHPLHRKKLQLAVKSINTKQEEKSGQLDHMWVTRWLDDIGLPQYKDQFYESRVDGRMLQYLTVNDLLFLKVTSQLHHLSIKCAIHVLHANKFNPHCLRRRPADENNISPSEVVQWSNHRVMEWLRSVDLAEYAPNLRGSGVHGGLIILEPRFNADTLAMLLNIPPLKTLLRRHLTTNFHMLIGPDAKQEKREIIECATYAPLNTTAKVRPKKLGFSHFSHLRKKKCDDSTDYVCPMDTSPNSTNGTRKTYGGFRGHSSISDNELDKLEQMEHSEGTVIQIGAFSQGISNLTHMLSKDEMLNNYRFLSATYEDWR
ncbi:liprin-beta-2 isoform X2 [Ambystoma mexicanum]|uniref:liprin-beta-2 isoform X2 n=1 Tax=Ambystoma mexicanum TaxID=8296 RepID=UPI0037E8EDCB